MICVASACLARFAQVWLLISCRNLQVVWTVKNLIVGKPPPADHLVRTSGFKRIEMVRTTRDATPFVFAPQVRDAAPVLLRMLYYKNLHLLSHACW